VDEGDDLDDFVVELEEEQVGEPVESGASVARFARPSKVGLWSMGDAVECALERTEKLKTESPSLILVPPSCSARVLLGLGKDDDARAHPFES